LNLCGQFTVSKELYGGVVERIQVKGHFTFVSLECADIDGNIHCPDVRCESMLLRKSPIQWSLPALESNALAASRTSLGTLAAKAALFALATPGSATDDLWAIDEAFRSDHLVELH
jgi:hypothetical protein